MIHEIDEVGYHGVRRTEAHISDDVSKLGDANDEGMHAFKVPSGEDSVVTDTNYTESHEEYISDEVRDICLVKHTEAVQFSLDMHAELENYELPPQRDPLDLLSRSSLLSRSNSRAISTPTSGEQSSANSNIGLEDTLPAAHEPQKPRKKIAFAFDVDRQLLGSNAPTPTTVKTLRFLQEKNISFTFTANHEHTYDFTMYVDIEQMLTAWERSFTGRDGKLDTTYLVSNDVFAPFPVTPLARR